MEKLNKENIEDILALTPMQEGMLFHYLKDPGSDYYFEQLSLEISGNINKEIFEKSWNVVVAANEMMRTVFRWEKLEKPSQIILKEHQCRVIFYDLSDKDGSQKETALEEIKKKDRGETFDLLEVPFRIILCKLAEKQYGMVISNHHILYDGWSNGIILKEFFKAYHKLYHREESLKLPVKPPFKEFIKWIQSRDRDKQAQFWRDYLAGFEAPPKLPIKRKMQETTGAGDYSIILEEDIKKKLEVFIKKGSATPTLPRSDRCRSSVGVISKVCRKNKVSEGISKKGSATPTHPRSDRCRSSVGVISKICRKNKVSEGISKNNRVSLASVFYTAWGVLLQRYCDSEDVIFGTTVSGRSGAIKGIENMVGLFINTLPLRTQTTPNEKIIDVVFRTDQVLREREEFENTPLPDIRSYSTVGGNESLFDTIVVIENYPLDTVMRRDVAPGRDAARSVSTVHSYSMVETTHYDLTVSIMFLNKIEIKFSYKQGLFENDVIENLAVHFKTIIQTIIDQPETALSQLEIISIDEKNRILYEFNNTAVEYPSDKTIHQLFIEQAAKTPDHIALVGTDLRVCPARNTRNVSLTYNELNEQSGRLAGLLMEKGVLPDTIVAIMMERSIEMVIGIFGILKSGGAYLPIDPDYPEERKHHMLKDSGAKLLAVANGLEGEKVGRWEGEKVLLKEIFNSLEISSYPLTFSTSYLLNSSNLAYLIYTSGSTGKPKGAVIEHHSLVNRLIWMQKKYPLNENDTILQKTTFTFDVSVWEIFWWSIVGAQLCLLLPLGEKDPKLIAQAIERNHITTMHFVPSMLSVFLDYLKRSGHVKKLSGLKQVIASGEALSSVHVEQFNELLNEGHGSLLANLYGPTEATIDVSYFDCLQERERKIIPIGKPIDNICLYILDKHLHIQPIGISGELCISGIGLARGYLNRPELTMEKFVTNYPSPLNTHNSPITLYRTGDLARWLSDGNIEFLGRIDQQVKIRGFRIELGEIEKRLQNHEAVKEVVVTARRAGKEADTEMSLCAYIVAAKELSAAGLQEYVALHLPAYMIPAYFIPLEKLPVGRNGKVNPEALPAPERVHAKLETTYVAPSDEIQKRIASAWQEVLQQQIVGIHDNFFDSGGNSLKLIRLSSRLTEAFKREITVTMLFQYPTISALARYLAAPEGAENSSQPLATNKVENDAMGNLEYRTSKAIAVIGMAGRFPGAQNITCFWENLKDGVESITFFSDKELEESGIAPELFSSPNYVKARGVLEEADHFDAAFFNCSPKEAEIMDPQVRVLLECAWWALEDAGYDTQSYEDSIGVYVGASNNSLWTRFIAATVDNSLEQFNAMILTGSDFLSTHIAYKMNLKGPGLTIQTACSTSLVAIDTACQALSANKCHMALAGGVSVSSQGMSGYIYEEGMIFSPDGHCRAFDAEAKGIVPGEGVGVVVLKRLDKALRDRDSIYAVVKGSAVNNDGRRKVGFTAPSIEGQVEVIRAARQMAQVEPDSIGYIETHGTGTELGDPVEFEALKKAFPTTGKQFCAIGSVKTNIGHLDAAAGVTAFIKTVLALKNKQIPPSLHFKKSNPKIEFENTPFYVIQRLSPWKNQSGPLRAGVSSFGVGGTNAHVVLEEWPGDERQEPEPGAPGKETQLILLSAKTKAALDSTTQNLADHFKKNPGSNLANAAYTLQVGRAAFKYRRMLACSNIHEVMDALSSPDSSHLHSFAVKEEKQPMVFMFPGQGSQYVDMGWGLYLKEPAFKEDMNRCFEILKSLSGYDIKEIIYPQISVSETGKEEITKKILQTEIAQPVLFVFEYALAKLLIRWGIKPDAMIGHSIGEYTAACLAGVFSLEDALSLVAMRGKLMQQLPPGKMVSVSLPGEKVKSLLTGELSLAAVNSSSLCTVSGPSTAVDSFEKRLHEKGYESRILHTSHAFHSKMMDAILDEFEKGIERINRHQPHIPFISNLSGWWITGEQAQSPRYWAQHLRNTVLFSQGINQLLKDHHVFLEVGPGKTLSTFVKKNIARKPGHLVEDLVRHPQENVHDYNFLLHRLGKLWLYGKDIDWSEFYHGKKRQRVPLPGYPFEKKRYWPDRHASSAESKKNPVDTILQGKKPGIADWFYIPNWERSSFPLFSLKEEIDTKSTCWLFFMDERGIGERLVKKFERNNNVIIVKTGSVFSRLSDREYAINPCEASSYDILLKELKRLELIPHRIVHLWGITGDMGGTLDIPGIRKALDLGFYSLFHLARGLGKHNLSHELRIMVLTDNMQEVTGKEALCPGKAPLLGVVKVIPLEYPHINCRCIDIVLPPGESGRQETDKLIDHLLVEITGDAHDKVIAFRGLHRWHPVIKPVRFELPAGVGNIRRIKPGGVYLVTGGLGGMGISIAQYLARSVRAKLVLVGRSTFPTREKWGKLGQKDNSTAENIRKIQEMEKWGAEVMVLSADVADEGQMRKVIDRVRKRFGKLNGIIHTAGVADYGGVIQRRTREDTEKILLPKVYGTVVLDRIVKDMKLDFFVLCSTIGNIAYHQKLGQVGYSAANEFLDAFAYYKNLRDAAAGKTDTLTVAINWPDLKDVGMAVKSSKQWAKMFNTDSQILLEDGLQVSEAIEVFRRVLDKGFPRVVVSPVNLVTKIEEGASLLREILEKGSVSSSVHQRPELTTTYVAPGNELEQMIASQFRQLFGIEKVGIHDNFFDLGASSLELIRFKSQLQKEIHREISIVALYTYPTIHSLAAHLSLEENSNAGEYKEEEKQKELAVSKNMLKQTMSKIKEKINDKR